ncbi:MAG: C4-dicarboxylate ABC transporter [Acidobacteria bacterium]|nr:MAG: C4-dicarboxylate ABC transporter [Acidobacteriota bacterium]
MNVGVLAFALAWIFGLLGGGGHDVVVKTFPAPLFVTLGGVTLLFALAESNGTLERLSALALRLARGDARALPILLFFIACAVSTVGPGAIASVALVAPMAMAVGRRAGISPFLIALAVTNGANAGNLSPVSAVGVIANTKMAEAGLGGHELKVWAANFAAHVIVGAAAYLALGGLRLSGREDNADVPAANPEFELAHGLTLAVIALWVAGVMALSLPLGLAAFAGACVLILLRTAEEADALRRMPWPAILMVTGMSALVGVVERTGGMALFTSLLARLASPASVNGVIAFVTGLITTYSSTSGVVLPAFLPTVPGLVRELGGGDPLAVALSINVGASIVDVSPLSTLGALCVAAVADPEVSKELFRRLMVWGLSMTLAGALLCQAFAGPFARL